MLLLLEKLDFFRLEVLGCSSRLIIVITSSMLGLRDSSLFMQAAAASIIRATCFEFFGVNLSCGSTNCSMVPCSNSGFACKRRNQNLLACYSTINNC